MSDYMKFRCNPPQSDHYDGVRFHNLDPSKQTKSFFDVLRWKLEKRAQSWPVHEKAKIPKTFPATVLPDEVFITFIGHSTLLMQFQGLTILIDPVFSSYVGPFARLAIKRSRLLEIEIDELPHIDLVLITHNHYDHFDLPSIEKIWEKFQPLFIVPLKNGSILEKMGINRIVELDWWESYVLNERQSICLTPAQHWSRRGLLDYCKALWGGYLVFSDHLKLFCAGDTGYASHFKEISKRFGPMDVSLLPIGAYEPRWIMLDQHMNPEDAVKAHLDLKSRLSIGIHFGSFNLSDESVNQPIIDLNHSLESHSVKATEFIAPKNGEIFHYPSSLSEEQSVNLCL